MAKINVTPTAASTRPMREPKPTTTEPTHSTKIASKVSKPVTKANDPRKKKTAAAITKSSKTQPESSSKRSLPEVITGKLVYNKRLKTTGAEWAVEKILDSRADKNGRISYKVKWEGYLASAATWEPAINLDNSAAKVKEFRKKYPQKP